jgi:hypothetical protein
MQCLSCLSLKSVSHEGVSRSSHECSTNLVPCVRVIDVHWAMSLNKSVKKLSAHLLWALP